MPAVDDRVAYERALHELVGEWVTDPLAFTLGAYPWGEVGGPLEAYPLGPDVWQREILTEIGRQVRAHGFDGVHPVLPIRVAVSSGRGAGKGALIAWLVDWIMSTRVDAIGTVTANTSQQLEEKTWAAIRTWTKRCLTAHWFEVNSAVLYRKGSRESWKCVPVSTDQPEAFQGQHNAASTSFVIFDEASGIDDGIFYAAEGGLTDGEPMLFVFFNPTKNTGYAHRAVFDGAARDRWTSRIVDSRTCRMANQQYIAEWLEDCGDNENDDFFRVHVRGLPPLASELQFIDGARIVGAQGRVVETLRDEPLICGVDVSGGGAAWTVARYRRGLDGRGVAPIRLNGEQSKDRNFIIAKLAEALRETGPRRIDAMFIDSAFGSPIVERLHVLGFAHVHEVNFGSVNTPDRHQANMRAFMWNKMKDWLLRGGIDPKDTRLAQDFAGPGFHLNQKDQLVLESKESMAKRGISSPDDADAVALTFAQAVAPPLPPVRPYIPRSTWA